MSPAIRSFKWNVWETQWFSVVSNCIKETTCRFIAWKASVAFFPDRPTIHDSDIASPGKQNTYLGWFLIYILWLAPCWEGGGGGWEVAVSGQDKPNPGSGTPILSRRQIKTLCEKKNGTWRYYSNVGVSKQWNFNEIMQHFPGVW